MLFLLSVVTIPWHTPTVIVLPSIKLCNPLVPSLLHFSYFLSDFNDPRESGDLTAQKPTTYFLYFDFYLFFSTSVSPYKVYLQQL